MNSIPTLYLDQILSVVRHLLTAASGWLLTRGMLSAEQGTQFVEVGGGVLMFVITVGLSFWQKHTAKKKLVVAMASAQMTEKSVDLIAASSAPSVLTPPTVVPVTPLLK